MFFKLLSAHPHLLERAKGAENGAANPGRELSLCCRDYFDFNILRCDFSHHALQSLREALEARVPASEDHVLEQVFANVDVGHADGVNNHVL